MPRVRNSVTAKRRHKKLLKMAKGYRLGRGNLYRTAKDQVEKVCSMLIATGARKKDIFGLYGLPELMLPAGSTGCPILNLSTV